MATRLATDPALPPCCSAIQVIEPPLGYCRLPPREQTVRPIRAHQTLLTRGRAGPAVWDYDYGKRPDFIDRSDFDQ